MADNFDERPRKGFRSLSRRSVLARTGLAMGAIGGVAGVTGLAAGQSVEVRYHGSDTIGSPGSTDTWNAMHVDAIAPANTNNVDAFFDAMRTGMYQLDEALGDWFAGYELRYYEIDYQIGCTGRVDAMADALDAAEPSIAMDEGFDDNNRLYHFASPCEVSPDRTQSPREIPGPPWGGVTDSKSRSISSIGDANRLLNDLLGGNNNYKVRAFHQALHAFIDGEIAKRLTGVENGYDAQHTLGTVDADGRRTVMADLATASQLDLLGLKDGYESEAKAGGNCGSEYSGSTSWPDFEDLGFSWCTKEALRLSARHHGLGQPIEILPPVGDNQDPPQDLNGDGLYRDVNGNGELELADVVDFFQNRDSDAVTNHVEAYDHSGNGGIDLADVVELFDYITS